MHHYFKQYYKYKFSNSFMNFLGTAKQLTTSQLLRAQEQSQTVPKFSAFSSRVLLLHFCNWAFRRCIPLSVSVPFHRSSFNQFCMNITRSFAGFLSSNPRKWGLLRSTFALRPLLLQTGVVVRHYGKGTKAPAEAADDLPVNLPTMKDFSELPRPIEIPFQPRVANSVKIVGTIDSGVKLHQLSDGSIASVLILVNENKEKPGLFPLFMIPVVFQGDLAEIAACHLKKNDLIYVSGQLTGENLPFMQKDTKENIKLIAHTLNFVTEASSYSGAMKTSDTVFGGNFRNSIRSNIRDQLWKKLVENPEQWLDNRSKKTKATQPDFRHKADGEALWLNSAPAWVFPKLPPQDAVNQLWKKLVENPEQWLDNRLKKTKATQPDFTHKDGEALWLDSAPAWVFPKLPPQDAVSK